MMSAPTWSDSPNYCAIDGEAYKNIVIDGGVNGIIQATDSGDELDYNGCNGIVFTSAGGITIKNLTIQNMFVRHQNSANTTGGGSAIWFQANEGSGQSTNLLVTNCVLHDAYIGVSYTYIANSSNFNASGNTIYNCNWDVSCGDSGSGASLNGLIVRNNTCSNWANWDDTVDDFHHDGLFIVGNNGYATNVVVCGNRIGPGYGAHTTGGIYVNGNVYNPLFFNNLLLATDGTSPANGLVTLGMNGPTPNSILLFNNTFVGGSQNATGVQFSTQTAQTDPPFYGFTNNLFYNVGTAVAGYWAGNSTWSANYNLYYDIPGSTIFSMSTTGDAAYDTWSYWTGTFGFDSHGTEGNPNLSGACAPQSPSAAIGAGATNGYALGVTTDLAGNARLPNGPVDIGAFDAFVPGLNEDAVFTTP
jgi:hypothetical protein